MAACLITSAATVGVARIGFGDSTRNNYRRISRNSNGERLRGTLIKMRRVFLAVVFTYRSPGQTGQSCLEMGLRSLAVSIVGEQQKMALELRADVKSAEHTRLPRVGRIAKSRLVSATALVPDSIGEKAFGADSANVD